MYKKHKKIYLFSPPNWNLFACLHNLLSSWKQMILFFIEHSICYLSAVHLQCYNSDRVSPLTISAHL